MLRSCCLASWRLKYSRKPEINHTILSYVMSSMLGHHWYQCRYTEVATLLKFYLSTMSCYAIPYHTIPINNLASQIFPTLFSSYIIHHRLTCHFLTAVITLKVYPRSIIRNCSECSRRQIVFVHKPKRNICWTTSFWCTHQTTTLQGRSSW